MKCPRCNAASDVLATRTPTTIGTLTRRRQCHNGHRFTTHEVDTAEMVALRAKARRYDNLRAVLRDELMP